MIKIKQLQYRYKGAEQAALQNVDLVVPANTMLGLLGPNGAGKTTLLSILSGLLPCPANTVFVDGCDIASRNASLRPRLSLVPQDYAFYQQLTVLENLTFFAGAQGLNKVTGNERIDEVSQITGLQDRLEVSAQSLSGGLKRRLNLAIGLLNKPQLLLLDEPTVGIDPHSRHFILEAIQRINAQGTTIIYTSHYMEEVEALCDEIAIVDHGKLLLQGPLQTLLQTGERQSFTVDLCELPTAESIAVLQQSLTFRRDLLRLNITINSTSDIIAALQKLQELQLDVGRIHYGANNLEELFLDITQRSLRD